MGLNQECVLASTTEKNILPRTLDLQPDRTVPLNRGEKKLRVFKAADWAIVVVIVRCGLTGY